LSQDPIDSEGAAALAVMLEIFDDETLSADFNLEPGQMQFVHNRALGHSRTAFEDHAEPGRRRHLIRLWLRDRGRQAYAG
jgi:alpha-ketoglutarate-dependent taurine dioxygenase